jgi:hypothetical protein
MFGRFSSIVQNFFDECNGLLAAQDKSLSQGLIAHSVLKSLLSYTSSQAPLALHKAKSSGLDVKDVSDKRANVSLAAAAAGDMERIAANLSYVSNFIQLTAETLYQLSLSAPLSDVQLADQNLLTLGLMIASRVLAVMTSVEEVNWRLVRRDTSLADSNLPKEVKTKLRRSKVSSETVLTRRHRQ